MKRALFTLLISTLAVLGGWTMTYRSYVDTHDEAVARLGAGDPAGALEALENYRSASMSAPIRRIALFGRLEERLRYNEGLMRGRLGDAEGAGEAFRETARSGDAGVAFASLYNLALLAVGRDDLEQAAAHLRAALALDPEDREAKVNLELVLKEIRARREGESPSKPGQQRSPGDRPRPGEQWRIDIPEGDGQGGAGSRRRYH